jgi:hypothetical protein
MPPASWSIETLVCLLVQVLEKSNAFSKFHDGDLNCTSKSVECHSAGMVRELK